MLAKLIMEEVIKFYNPVSSVVMHIAIVAKGLGFEFLASPVGHGAVQSSMIEVLTVYP